MNNYIPYNPNSNKNNFYPYYSNNPNDIFNHQKGNSNEQKNQNSNRKDVYNIYNSYFHNINYNAINSDKKNKNVSLQDEILSPNIEDSRPTMPAPIYYDDTRYKNFYNFNLGYNQRYYEKNKIITNNNNYPKEKRGIFEINEHKNINYNKKMLILDLDETLVHSCFKPADNINSNLSTPDILLKIKFHSKVHEVFVYKRPFVDEFLKRMSNFYNLIIFTASVQEYADPLLDQLDKNKLIKLRYYRNSCLLDKNRKFVKNLAIIYNDLKNVILLDNNPISYSYNKSNGLPIITWHFDKRDRELLKIIPILEFLSNVNDIRNYLPRFIEFDMVNFTKFNLLIDEINKERQQNINLNDFPKTSKHVTVSNQEKQTKIYVYNNNNEKKLINNKEDKNNTKNQVYPLNNPNNKFNTIDNNSSKKEKESISIIKNILPESKDLEVKKNIKNLRKDLLKEERKKEKNKARKTSNLFNKNNKYEKIKENKNEKNNINGNRSIDYLIKENKNDKFIIVNEKHKKPNINNTKIKILKNNPFIMNSAEKVENKKFNFFSGLKNDAIDRNKNIQINIINNIQQINLFKNDFEVNNNNIKKIDIINYYKNNSQKKQEKMNNSFFIRNSGNENKIKNENKRNKSYSNIHDSNRIINKNKKNEINNSPNFMHNTAQNFYPKNTNNTNYQERSNSNKSEMNQKIHKNDYFYNYKTAYPKESDNNRYSIYNNYIFNNYKSQNKTIQNDHERRIQSYDKINYIYRPLSINYVGNSNYNNFYNNINHRNINQINNIFPIYPVNNYNYNNINYRYNLNNNYIY